VAQRLGELRLPGAGDAQQEDAARPGQRAAAPPQDAGAELLQRPQAAQVGERLAAPVQAEQARLLQRVGLEVPEDARLQPPVADQGEAQGVLGLHAGHPPRRVEDGLQAVPLGQLARLGRQRAGDGLDLVAAGQVVVDQDELLFQLDGDLYQRRQDDDDGSGGLPGVDLGVEGLDDLHGVQESVEVLEHEEGGALGGGQGAERADRGQRVGRLHGRGRVGRRPGQGQSPVDVPGGQGPALVAAEPGDLPDGVLVLEGVDVDAAEGGAHEFPQALGERHGLPPGVIG